jgi:hypothetical protein
MVKPFTIEDSSIYDDGSLVIGLGIPSSRLARARRSGSLRFTRVAGRPMYLGRWLLRWLEGDGAEKAQAEGALAG